MTDLVSFLRERLDEDEQGARAATAGPWVWTGEQCYSGEDCSDDHAHSWGHMGPDLYGNDELVLTSGGYDADQVIVSRPDAVHIARHDPSRVLAEVAAKRAILDDHWNLNAELDEEHWVCARCHSRSRHDAMRWPCPTLRALVLPFRDHPEFDPDWTEETR